MRLDDKTPYVIGMYLYYVTEWFPMYIKPVRIGWYQVHTPYWNDNHYSYWNGKYFEACVSEAIHGEFRSESQDLYVAGCKWRGLTHEVI